MNKQKQQTLNLNSLQKAKEQTTNEYMRLSWTNCTTKPCTANCICTANFDEATSDTNGCIKAKSLAQNKLRIEMTDLEA